MLWWLQRIQQVAYFKDYLETLLNILLLCGFNECTAVWFSFDLSRQDLVHNKPLCHLLSFIGFNFSENVTQVIQSLLMKHLFPGNYTNYNCIIELFVMLYIGSLFGVCLCVCEDQF